MCARVVDTDKVKVAVDECATVKVAADIAAYVFGRACQILLAIFIGSHSTQETRVQNECR